MSGTNLVALSSYRRKMTPWQDGRGRRGNRRRTRVVILSECTLH